MYTNSKKTNYADTILCDLKNEEYDIVIKHILGRTKKLLFTTYLSEEKLSLLPYEVRKSSGFSASNMPYFAADINADIKQTIFRRGHFIVNTNTVEESKKHIFEDYCFLDEHDSRLLSVTNHEGDIEVSIALYEELLPVFAVLNEHDRYAQIDENLQKTTDHKGIIETYLSLDSLLSYFGEAYDFRSLSRKIYSIDDTKYMDMLDKLGLSDLFTNKAILFFKEEKNDNRMKNQLLNEEFQIIRRLLETKYYDAIKTTVKIQ